MEFISAFFEKNMLIQQIQSENFSETYSRNWYEKQKIYDEGKMFQKMIYLYFLMWYY